MTHTHPIVLIDFSSLAHPIWHTTANEPDPNAMSTAIVAKVRALASGQPHVALCLDSRQSFRKELDATYKAGRESKPEAFWHQSRLALETLRGDGFPTWEASGFEADDIIASAVHQSYQPNDTGPRVLIITSDKDLLQLVDGAVTVKNAVTGNVIDVAAVSEKFGVTPNQIQDYLTIVGDASDGVVGIKGIGAKGAALLLAMFGNLDDLYTAIDKGEAAIKPAQLLALNEFRPRLPMVRQLLALRTDASIPFAEIFAERVPADVAVFGGDMDDINEAMPTVGINESKPSAGFNESKPLRELSPTEAADLVLARMSAHLRRHPAPATSAIPPTGESARTDVRRIGDQPAPIPPTASVAVPVAASIPSEPNGAASAVSFDRQLEPRNIQEAKELAKWMFESRLFSAYGTPQAVLSVVLAGRELGLPAMASLRAFHIVEGKPTLAADFIRALVLKSGLVTTFRCTERTPERATFLAQRGDEPAITMSYTVEEAKQAGIVKPGSGWTKNPADMCVARCSSKLARLIAPEVVFGIYAPDEFDS